MAKILVVAQNKNGEIDYNPNNSPDSFCGDLEKHGFVPKNSKFRVVLPSSHLGGRETILIDTLNYGRYNNKLLGDLFKNIDAVWVQY